MLQEETTGKLLGMVLEDMKELYPGDEPRLSNAQATTFVNTLHVNIAFMRELARSRPAQIFEVLDRLGALLTTIDLTDDDNGPISRELVAFRAWAHDLRESLRPAPARAPAA